MNTAGNTAKPSLCVDCHFHTSRYSACSRVDPEDAVTLARLRGLDVLVITEHHRRWPERELEELRALAPVPRQSPGLAILSGMEVTLAEGYDVVLLGDDVPEALEPGMLLDDLQRLRSGWGPHFAFVAHPFRFTNYMDLELARILDVVDGIEMVSCNIIKAGYVRENGLYVSDRTELYDMAKERNRLVPVYTSDAHTEPAVGALTMDVDVDTPVRSMADLVRALKTTTPRMAQDPALVSRVLALYGLL